MPPKQLLRLDPWVILPILLAASCSSARHHQAPHSAHRFQNAERWARVFEGPERDRWQKPAALLALLEIKPAMRIVEIGSGTGYFAVRLARQVSQGRVWGADIEPDMVHYLNRRARRENLTRLKSYLAVPDDPRIPEAVDMIFVCNTYHHIAKRSDYFRKISSRLKPEGRLVIVDFKMGKIPVGPPEKHRVTPQQLEAELSAAGYRRALLDTETLPYQYVAVFLR